MLNTSTLAFGQSGWRAEWLIRHATSGVTPLRSKQHLARDGRRDGTAFTT
jgi:hypothetical protein